MKKADPNPKANRNILKLVYVIVALFLGLIAYMAYFLQARGEDVINNSYNARLDSFADRIIRGKILAADGTVLAETQIDGDGNETRVYPVSYTHLSGQLRERESEYPAPDTRFYQAECGIPDCDGGAEYGGRLL